MGSEQSNELVNFQTFLKKVYNMMPLHPKFIIMELSKLTLDFDDMEREYCKPFVFMIVKKACKVGKMELVGELLSLGMTFYEMDENSRNIIDLISDTSDILQF